MRQHVAGPAGEGIVRGIDQVVGAIGGHLGTILHIGVHVAVACADRPVLGHAAHGRQLNTLHPFAAGLGGVAGVVQHGAHPP
ncbi:hypothetical protein G6F59_018073 [Rhizopus arrhizus]|nr:hypothetical protein G6F59_018073 [Rhizopus arrhizus]